MAVTPRLDFQNPPIQQAHIQRRPGARRQLAQPQIDFGGRLGDKGLSAERAESPGNGKNEGVRSQ